MPKVKSKNKSIRCEGWRRYGGFMTLGPVTWEQCENDAVVNLMIIQDGEKQNKPACITCWEEAMSTDGIRIIRTEPLGKGSNHASITKGKGKK